MNHIATTCENKLQFKSCLHFNTQQCYKSSSKKTHFTDFFFVVLYPVPSSFFLDLYFNSIIF